MFGLRNTSMSCSHIEKEMDRASNFLTLIFRKFDIVVCDTLVCYIRKGEEI